MKIENLNDIAEALVAQKGDFIIIDFVSLSIVIIAVIVGYFITRLKNSAELKKVNNNFSIVLKQQKYLAKEVGEIRQSLNKDSINHQIRLNAYHDKTIEAVAEIYIALIQLRDSAKDRAFSRTDEDNEKYRKMLDEFSNTFDIQKIWVPERLLKNIKTVATEIDNQLEKFTFACNTIDNAPNSSEEKLTEAINEQNTFYDFIYNEVGATCDQLAEDIANEISVENA